MKRKFITIQLLLLSLIFTGSLYSKNGEISRKSVVRIKTTYVDPSYDVPWKVSNPGTKTGSGAIVKGKYILTNAHVVANATLIQVQKENDPDEYNAKVVFVGHDCDLALLEVNNSKFFKGTTSLKFGDIPELQSKVTTYGYPTGGERISVTAGVVSRIEFGVYYHSGRERLLRIQTDAALNPGNSGGPVIQNSVIVGVAFQVQNNSDNIGYMIPVPIIDHFFKDIKDGRYDGFPALGAITNPLGNIAFRKYMKMKPEQTGIIISKIIPRTSAQGILQKDDIIVKVDGKSVANDGSIQLKFGQIRYSFLLDSKQIGETVKITILRNGTQLNKTITLKKAPERIAWFNEYEKMPEYYIYGGMIFMVLSREYLKTWKKWWYNAQRRMVYYYSYNATDNIAPWRKKFVLINKIIPDQSNTYISNFRDEILYSINGIKITSLKDVPYAFSKPKGKYHILRFDGIDSPLVLNVSDTKNANKRIQEKYRIPRMSTLED